MTSNKKASAVFYFTGDGEHYLTNIMLKIDYLQRVYSLSPYFGNGEAFIFKAVNKPEKHIALLDVMSQAIKFAEKELKGEEKKQENVKQKKEMTMGELRRLTRDCSFQIHIPNDAKVIFEWQE